MGTSNYDQANGTFTGSTSAITFSGTFTISGGTFNAGAQTITSAGNWTYTSGTINAGSSTLVFYNTALTITGTQTLNNVTFNNTSGSIRIFTIASGTVLTTSGTLTQTD